MHGLPFSHFKYNSSLGSRKDYTMHRKPILAQHFIGIVRFLFIVFLALFGLSVAYVLCIVTHRRIRAFRSPLRDVPGPKKAHWLKGNFVDVPEPDATRLQEEWVKTYGHVLKYYSLLGVRVPFPFTRDSLVSYADHPVVCRLQSS
jgi:hypothetical protein